MEFDSQSDHVFFAWVEFAHGGIADTLDLAYSAHDGGSAIQFRTGAEPLASRVHLSPWTAGSLSQTVLEGCRYIQSELDN